MIHPVHTEPLFRADLEILSRGGKPQNPEKIPCTNSDGGSPRCTLGRDEKEQILHYYQQSPQIHANPSHPRTVCPMSCGRKFSLGVSAIHSFELCFRDRKQTFCSLSLWVLEGEALHTVSRYPNYERTNNKLINNKIDATSVMPSSQPHAMKQHVATVHHHHSWRIYICTSLSSRTQPSTHPSFRTTFRHFLDSNTCSHTSLFSFYPN